MYALGIDLGTTFSAAAVWRDGHAEVASLGSRGVAIPSVVLLREDETIVTGEAANRRGLTEPHRVAREFKRRLGDTTPILLGGTPYSAEALSGRLLRSMVDEVAAREGGQPSAICVSHPANWGPYKTDLLRQAVRMADLDVPVTLITEPEAAAIFYAHQQRMPASAVVAVYDLGGGTFDAAVLRKTGTGFDLLGRPEGIERLGGIDFDAAVFAHVSAALGGSLAELDEDDPAAIAAVARLREECTQAKEALSADTDTSMPVLLPNVSTEVRLTRAELEAMVRPALHDTIEALRRALRSAGVTPDQLHSVLLVGGSSRMPIVAQMVGSELGRPVAVDAHPKHAIALGAAWVASGEPTESADDADGDPGDTVHGGSPLLTSPVGIPAAGAPAAAAGAGALTTAAAGPPATPLPAAHQATPYRATPHQAAASQSAPQPPPPQQSTPQDRASQTDFLPRYTPDDFPLSSARYHDEPPARRPGWRVPAMAAGAAVVLAGGVYGWTQFGPGGGTATAGPTPSASATAAASASGATPSASALPADEQCTDAIMANTRWVCLTSATFDGTTLTIDYDADFAGTPPDGLRRLPPAHLRRGRRGARGRGHGHPGRAARRSGTSRTRTPRSVRRPAPTTSRRSATRPRCAPASRTPRTPWSRTTTAASPPATAFRSPGPDGLPLPSAAARERPRDGPRPGSSRRAASTRAASTPIVGSRFRQVGHTIPP